MNVSRKIILFSTVFLAVLLIGGGYLLKEAYNNYEVVNKGQLLDHTSGYIYQIRFFDKFDIYLEPENRPNSDLVTFCFLLGSGFIGMVFFFILGTGQAAARPRVLWLYLITFFGMNYLAFDEFLGIHESIGHNMPFLTALPFVKRPDDAIVMFYLIPCAIFALLFYTEFLSCTKSILAGVLAFGLIFLAAVSDVLTLPLEEPLEVLAGACIFCSFLFLGQHHLNELYAEKPSLRFG